MRIIAPISLILLLVAACCGTDPPPGQEAFPALFPDRQLFLWAIGTYGGKPLPPKINGLTVPHHLLAADLLAAAFSALRARITAASSF